MSFGKRSKLLLVSIAAKLTTTTMLTMPGVDCALLLQEKKSLSDLKDDIRQLLSNFMDVASVQSKEIASLSAILQDTVAWDPASGQQLSSCSTPKQLPWTEVLVCSGERDPDGSASPPGLNLSNLPCIPVG